MRRAACLVIVTVLALAPALSSAVDKCHVKVNPKTGALEVSATRVGANPKWGSDPGAVHVAFADTGTCFSRGALSKCHLGTPGTLAERTPPEGCIVYVNDGGTPCAALIKGCTPGARMRDASFTAVNDSRGVLFNGVFHPGAILTGANLTGANLSAVDLSGGVDLSGANLTGADLSGANLTGAGMNGGMSRSLLN